MCLFSIKRMFPYSDMQAGINFYAIQSYEVAPKIGTIFARLNFIRY